MQGVFNPNILIYHLPNSAEGLHFSAFRYLRAHNCRQLSTWVRKASRWLKILVQSHFDAGANLQSYSEAVSSKVTCAQVCQILER